MHLQSNNCLVLMVVFLMLSGIAVTATLISSFVLTSPALLALLTTSSGNSQLAID